MDLAFSGLFNLNTVNAFRYIVLNREAAQNLGIGDKAVSPTYSNTYIGTRQRVREKGKNKNLSEEGVCEERGGEQYCHGANKIH